MARKQPRDAEKEKAIWFAVRLLGEWGFHGRTIQESIYEVLSEDVTVQKVYSICKALDIRLRDYRDGIGRNAEHTVGIVHRRVNARYNKIRRRAAAH